MSKTTKLKVSKTKDVSDKKLTRFLKNHIWHIQNCANLTSFCVTINPMSREKLKQGQHYMDIETDHEYLMCKLEYNPDRAIPDFKNKKYEELIGTLCHEISHIVTSESFDRMKIKYKDEGKYYQERLTEHVSRWLARLYYYRFMPTNNIDISTGETKTNARSTRSKHKKGQPKKSGK